MLGLLSKPQAAAELLSSEAHLQASTSTAPPTLPPHAYTAERSQRADLQVAPALEAPVSEASNNDAWTSGKVAQPVLAEAKHAVSQEAASGAAAKEAGAPEYQHNAWQSPAVPGVAQSVPQTGSNDAALPAKLPASEPELSKDTLPDRPRASAEEARRPSTGQFQYVEEHLHPNYRQPVVAGMPSVTCTEQAELRSALNTTSMAGANQQPLVHAADTTGQQSTAANKQLVAAGGSTTGKGVRHKGGGKGPRAQKLGGQLTGSAAHALAVLQAGPPSRSVRTEQVSGVCMLLVWCHLFTQQ